MQFLERTPAQKEALALEFIEYLNHLLEFDTDAIANLCENRIFCNKDLADHQTVQVQTLDSPAPAGAAALVGLLGILNGFVGTRHDGYGYITAHYEDNGEISRFELTRSTTA
jgi:hypothetical protein